MSILHTQSLTKVYDSDGQRIAALNQVDLAVEEGEFLAIMGPSGSGKSTLLYLLGGLDRPSSGKVWLRDSDVFALDDDSLSRLRRMVTGEALLLGVFGAAMGVLAGVAMSYGFITAFSIVGWEMPYFFPVMGIIAAVVVGVILALFAAILPARSAAKLDIIRALQYE